jgi:hypothetical protein
LTIAQRDWGGQVSPPTMKACKVGSFSTGSVVKTEAGFQSG